MDAFESIIALLLRLDGYWTRTSYKVELTRSEKVAIGSRTSPRWEIDVVGYRPADNEILAIECKSYLNSGGVQFDGTSLVEPDRYKLFTRPKTRQVVLTRLAEQLTREGLCLPNPKVTLGLAAGKLYRPDGESEIEAHFAHNGWMWLGPKAIASKLQKCTDTKYENDVVYMTAKILGANQ